MYSVVPSRFSSGHWVCLGASWIQFSGVAAPQAPRGGPLTVAFHTPSLPSFCSAGDKPRAPYELRTHPQLCHSGLLLVLMKPVCPSFRVSPVL
jgi:hypothetical protein